MEVVFDAKELVGKITDLVEVQLPRATAIALNKSMFETRNTFKSRSQQIFTSAVPFTRNAVLYDKATRVEDRFEGRVYLRDDVAKGNAPASYLRPQIEGGQVFPTRFQRRLRARGYLGGSQGAYMQPQLKNGRLTAGAYTRALWGIQAFEDLRISGRYGKRNYATAGSYMFVPKNLAQLGSSDISSELTARMWNLRRLNGKIPAAGIYQVKGGSLTQRFVMLDQVPTVSRKFDFQAFAEDEVEKVFSEELLKNILR